VLILKIMRRWYQVREVDTVNRRKVNSVSLLLGLIVFLGGSSFRFAPPASDGIFFGTSIPSTQQVDNEAVLTGDQVTIDGTVNGNVLAVGTDININGSVQGSLIAIGQRVTLNGSVGGSIYSAALEMNLGPSAVVNQNVFFVGMSLVSDQGSVVRRDLYAGTLGAQLSGTISRNTNAVIGPVNLIQNLIDALGGSLSLPAPRSQTPGGSQSAEPADYRPIASIFPINWNGKFTQDLQAPIVVGPIRSPFMVPQYRSIDTGDIFYQIETTPVVTWMAARVREFFTIALIGLVAIWLFPTLFYRGFENLRKKPLAAAGYGSLELILALNLAGVIGLLILIVSIVGLWLGPRTTWALSWVIWGLTFFGAGLALTVLWVFVFFISKAIAAYSGVMLFLGRVSPAAARHRIIPLLIGLFLYVLIASIPMIGFVVEIIAIALGLGATWLAYRNRSQSPVVVVMKENVHAAQESPGDTVTSAVPVTGHSSRDE